MSKVYFFRNTEYCRYNAQTDATDPDYPRPIAGNWTGLPAQNIDAALNWGDGKVYFFSGSQYYRYDTKLEQVDPFYPKMISDHWNGLTLDRVDACVNWGNGKVYFFRGDRLWLYNIADDRTEAGYPKKISAAWSSLFNALSEANRPFRIDAAINWGNGKAYFFRGRRYVRVKVATRAVEAGWPKMIASHWPGLFTENVRAPVMLGFAGIDRSDYPGDTAMRQLFRNSNLTWTGFYLAPAPSHSDAGWMNRFAVLSAMGWGIAPIYVGQQQGGPGSHVLTPFQGALDAADAVRLASDAGIPDGSVIYLDIETGPPLGQPMKDYYSAWVAAIAMSAYRPGVYCSYLVARDLLALDSRPIFWVFKVKSADNGEESGARTNPYKAVEPSFSTVEFASLWQWAQNVPLRKPGSTQNITPMDFNTSSMRNPLTIS